MSRLIRALIDTGALRHNLATIRARAGGARILAVVKANAYGHGLVQTALALAQADGFAVARLEEGITLREHGITRPVVLLEGVFTAEQLREAARHELELVVHDALQVHLLEADAAGHRFRLWLKIDTGMNRLGFRESEFPEALRRLERLSAPPLEIRLMTHLARADDSPEMTQAQLGRFARAAQGRAHATSIANSAGVFGETPVGGEWVRPGLALYGASPFADRTAEDLNLRPAMTLTTSVIAVRFVPRGETVGYGSAWRAERDSRIAIAAAGYGDGLPRGLPNGTPVLIDGRRAPLCGRVSMDMIAVDVTELGPVAVGTPVVLWGEGLAVEEVARWAGTVAYELLCGVSQRVPLELR